MPTAFECKGMSYVYTLYHSRGLNCSSIQKSAIFSCSFFPLHLYILINWLGNLLLTKIVGEEQSRVQRQENKIILKKNSFKIYVYNSSCYSSLVLKPGNRTEGNILSEIDDFNWGKRIKWNLCHVNATFCVHLHDSKNL